MNSSGATLKLIVLTKTGRSGSLFFQHLMDQHSKILSLPYIFNFYYSWNQIPNNLSQDPEKTVAHFLEKTSLREIFHWESEAYSLILDPAAQSQVELPSKEEMKKEILSYFLENSFNRKNLLIAIHLAYAKITKLPIEAKTHIFLHEHNGYYYDQMREDFEDFRLLVLMRDPRSSYYSFIQSYLQLGVPIRSLVFETNALYSEMNNETFERFHPKQIISIKIEDLNENPEREMQRFCAFAQIPFESSVLQATCLGYSTTINSSRIKGLTGFNNKKIKENIWESKCSQRELFLVQSIHFHLMKSYGSQKSELLLGERFWFFFFVLLPDFKAFFTHNPSLKNKLEYIRRRYWLRFRKDWLKLLRTAKGDRAGSQELYLER
jgi:hypothetical protein